MKKLWDDAEAWLATFLKSEAWFFTEMAVAKGKIADGTFSEFNWPKTIGGKEETKCATELKLKTVINILESAPEERTFNSCKSLFAAGGLPILRSWFSFTMLRKARVKLGAVLKMSSERSKVAYNLLAQKCVDAWTDFTTALAQAQTESASDIVNSIMRAEIRYKLDTAKTIFDTRVAEWHKFVEGVHAIATSDPVAIEKFDHQTVGGAQVIAMANREAAATLRSKWQDLKDFQTFDVQLAGDLQRPPNK